MSFSFLSFRAFFLFFLKKQRKKGIYVRLHLKRKTKAQRKLLHSSHFCTLCDFSIGTQDWVDATSRALSNLFSSKNHKLIFLTYCCYKKKKNKPHPDITDYYNFAREWKEMRGVKGFSLNLL